MARYYIDCEFDGHGGEMLSMAVIGDDGRGLYLCIADKPDMLSDWVEANVWPLVHAKLPVGRTVSFTEDWGSLLRSHIGPTESHVIIADSPVDIWRFCEAISSDGPHQWHSVDNPKLTFEVHNVDCYPTDLPGAVQHNAWWDAMALKAKLTQGIAARSGETRSGLIEDESVTPSGGDARNPYQSGFCQ